MKELLIVVAALIGVGPLGFAGAKEYVGGPDICRLFKDGTQLREPGYCTKYVRCENFKSIGMECSGTKPYWNKDSGSCVARVSDAYCGQPCKAKSPRYVSDVRNCQGWYECSDGVPAHFGFCVYNLVFDLKKQMCVYPEDTSCRASYDFCDVVPKSKPFMDENNCHQYFQCNTLNRLTSKTCDAGEYFDAATATCRAKSKVKCVKHPYPENVCGTTKLAYRNRFVDDAATCRGYFYCQNKGVGIPDTTPTWGQCPANEFFDPQQQLCIPRTHMKCAEDRCDGRLTGRALSERTGCQYYLECADNTTLRESYCGDGLFYNAETQACTTTRIAYPACS